MCILWSKNSYRIRLLILYIVLVILIAKLFSTIFDRDSNKLIPLRPFFKDSIQEARPIFGSSEFDPADSNPVYPSLAAGITIIFVGGGFILLK